MSVRARPTRSAQHAASTPPIAEADSVTVDSAPVAPVPTPNVAPIALRLSVSTIRSKASSAKPANAARKPLRPRSPSAAYQLPDGCARAGGGWVGACGRVRPL